MQDNNEAGASRVLAGDLRRAWAAGSVEDELREQLIRTAGPALDVVPSERVVALLIEIADLRRRLHPIYRELLAR